MLRLVFVVSLLLVPSTAIAGWTRWEPDRRDGYVGAMLFVFEMSLDAGWRVPVARYLWVRGRLGAGFEPGDSSDEKWTVGLVGLELRTPHRFLRLSLGLEAGGMRTSHINEDGSPVERDWAYAWSWHAFAEVGDRVMGRFGVQSLAPYGGIPAPTVGIAGRF
jgi:hypothetical protein